MPEPLSRKIDAKTLKDWETATAEALWFINSTAAAQEELLRALQMQNMAAAFQKARIQAGDTLRKAYENIEWEVASLDEI